MRVRVLMPGTGGKEWAQSTGPPGRRISWCLLVIARVAAWWAAEATATDCATMRSSLMGKQTNSHLVGDEKWWPVSPVGVRQQTIGLVVAYDLLCFRIETQRPAQTVGGVRQMDQCAGDVPFFDGRVKVLRLSSPDTIDEVGEVIAA